MEVTNPDFALRDGYSLFWGNQVPGVTRIANNYNDDDGSPNINDPTHARDNVTV